MLRQLEEVLRAQMNDMAGPTPPREPFDAPKDVVGYFAYGECCYGEWDAKGGAPRSSSKKVTGGCLW